MSALRRVGAPTRPAVKTAEQAPAASAAAPAPAVMTTIPKNLRPYLEALAWGPVDLEVLIAELRRLRAKNTQFVTTAVETLPDWAPIEAAKQAPAAEPVDEIDAAIDARIAANAKAAAPAASPVNRRPVRPGVNRPQEGAR